MKIALIGYGKMGKAIDAIALQKGHTIVGRYNSENKEELTIPILKQADVAIEFSTPDSAVQNLQKCFEANVPVVCGTTGWLSHLRAVKENMVWHNGCLLYASNFSIGVNLFFELNDFLAKIMSKYKDYDVFLEEIHHIHKKDTPSGTAIALAESVIKHIPTKSFWTNLLSTDPKALTILSKRIDDVPGTHSITYESSIDNITITHTAHNRTGFASGAVLAAKFIKGKRGFFDMKDVLGIN